MFNEFIVNKQNLINNIQTIKRDNLGSLVCAMVKANAYGVGLQNVVSTLNDYVDFFGVTNLQEAKQTAKYTTKKVLIVGALENEVDNRFSYSCHCLEDVQKLAKTNQTVNIHLKINTGMNRFGFDDIKDYEKALKIIQKSNLVLEGLFTHFATTDKNVEKQMFIFDKYVIVAKQYNFKPIVHVDNSFVNETNNHHKDMVRIGFDLYNRKNQKFTPVVEIKTQVVQINKVKKGELVGYNYRFVAPKKMDIAVVPVGYADGFSLNYVGMYLKVFGVKCRVLNICMDCFMLDVTGLEIKKGDVIQILGTDISLDNYADFAKISAYEVMTRFAAIRATRKLI
ncbi:MAG: alanine racemase [Clostridia bacterium]|nr:alanine racemase [Clostridia bacterium]